MTIRKARHPRGIILSPDDVALEGIAGELKVGLTSQRLEAYLQGAAREILTANQTQTLTNKTIDVDNNTISNLEVDNLKAGVLNTSSTLASASDTQVPSALAVKAYADSVASTAQTNLDNHINDVTDAHDASAISSVPSGNLAATDVQAALNELQSDVDTRATTTALNDHINDTVDAHDASAISSVPSGNLAATDVQAALNELQSDVDTRATTSALSAHTGASSGVHGVTGNVVGTSDTQTLSNKTLTAPVVNNASVVTPSRLDVKQDTKANLDTYADTASAGQLTYATDQKKFYGVVDNDLKSLGGGSQGLDTFVQLYADEQITDWSTGNNATFLGGGTLAGTLARVTSGQLNGDASYRYTQAAGSLNDYVASPVQAVPVRFRGQTASITMFYNYDGNNNDVELVVWDVTNSAKLTDASNNSISASSGAIYKANITIPATCTQIRVGFEVNTANSGKILNFDDIEISADVTKYSNATLIQTIELTGGSSTNANITNWTVARNTNNGLLSYSSGIITVLKQCVLDFSATSTQSGAGATGIYLRRNGVNVASSNIATSTYNSTAATSIYANPGDTFVVFSEGARISAYAQLVASSIDANIITAPESFSTDTAQLTYAGSGTYTLTTLANAPVGTFITFTTGLNTTNTHTQTTTAPTQTTADMNVNGIRIFTRPYNAASTAASPARLAIQIGKGLKGLSISGFSATGKSGNGIEFQQTYQIGTTTFVGALASYNEVTGILLLDAATVTDTTLVNHYWINTSGNGSSDGYFVINASKSPALVGVPQVQPRIATISDVKSSGTAGGTATSGSYQTRTLNTLSDPTGIVTSLTSNQFTLPAGEYYIEASAPAFYVAAHKIKLRNVTDSTDALLGTVAYATSAVADGSDARSIINGVLTVSSSKTFEIQHRVNTTRATNGFGIDAGMGDNNVYTLVKITKVK